MAKDKWGQTRYLRLLRFARNDDKSDLFRASLVYPHQPRTNRDISKVKQTTNPKMENRKTLYAAIALTSIGLVYFLAPEEKLEKLSWKMRSLAAPKVNECVKVWESKFDNPDSLIVLDDMETQEGGKKRLTIEYKAQNMYGAYVRNYLYCGLDSSGNIDVAETFKYINNPYYFLLGEEAAVPAF